MKVALVLHIYQPPVQEESIIRQVASECYLPLLKTIKGRRSHKFTLNIPLSLLELMDKYGYKDWISDVRSLYESDRIELTGSGAYHPLLTELPQQLVEEQVSLNEYGLGYYLGSKQGFEGEPSIMIKNIQGFFPPELAVNEGLVDTLSSFGYKWFIAEKTALPQSAQQKDESVFEIKNKNIKVVCRDRDLSNLLSFKRDLVMDGISSYLQDRSAKDAPIVIALDGEFFGHHYREGAYLLENFLDKLEELGVTLETVSEIVDQYESHSIDGVVESSWGASDEEFSNGDVYPFWLSEDNSLQIKLWELQNIIIDSYMEKGSVLNTSEFQISPIWKTDEIKAIQDIELQQQILKYILVHKYLHSDKFWWSSKKEILGKYLYHPGLVRRSLDIVREIFSCCPNEDIKSDVNLRILSIEELLK